MGVSLRDQVEAEIKLRKPAGERAEISAPDPRRSHSTSSLRSRVEEEFLITQPLPTVRPEGLLSKAGTLATGIPKAAADIAGAPADLLNLAEQGLEAIGVPDPLVLLPESLQEKVRSFLPGKLPLTSKTLNALAKKGMEALGVNPKTIDPDTPFERIAQRIVRETTGAVIGVGLLRKLSTAIRATPRSTQYIREAISGALSGAAGGTVKEATDNPVAEILAQVSAGFGPDAAIAVGRLANRLVIKPGARSIGSPKALEAQVREALRETLGDQEMAAKQFAEAQEVQKLVPGFEPTLAEATGAPGLLLAQRAERAKGTELAGALTSRREQNIDLVMDRLRQEFLEGSEEDIGDVQRALSQQRGRVEGRLGVRVTGRQDELARIGRETARNKAGVLETVARGKETASARAARTTAQINRRVRVAETQAENAALELRQGGIPVADIPSVTGDTVRLELGAAEKVFRREASRMYNKMDPENKIAGQAGTLVDKLQRLYDNALESFDQRDIPSSLREFFASMKLRALRENGEMPRLGAVAKSGAVVADDQLELQAFIRRQGGIRTQNEELASELEALTSVRETGTTGLLSKNGGLTLQEMAEKAQEFGFIGSADKTDLLDALGSSLRNGRSYSSANTDVFGDLLEFSDNPDAVKTAAAGLTSTDLRNVTVTLSDLQHLRSRVLQDGRNLSGVGGGRSAALVDQTVAIVNQAMRQVAEAAGDPQAIQRLTEADIFYRAHIGKFRAGAGGEILSRRMGEARIPGSQVVQRYLQTPERAKEFVATIGSQPEAVAALETYLDNDLLLTAPAALASSARLGVKKARDWLRKRAPILDQFPELKEKYNTIVKLQEKVDRATDASARLIKKAEGRAKDVEALGAEIEAGVARHTPEELTVARERLKATEDSVKAQRARIDKSAANKFVGDATVGDAMARMFSLRRNERNREMMRIVSAFGDDQLARRGFLREMWDTFLTQPANLRSGTTFAGNPMLQPGLVQRFLNTHRPVLQELMGKEHFRNTQILTRGLKMSRLADAPPVVTGSPTAELQQQGKTAQQVVKALTPRRITANIKLRILTLAVRKGLNFLISMRPQAVENMVHEVLFDPDIAKTFAMLTTERMGATRNVLRSRLNAHLTMMGIGHRTADILSSVTQPVIERASRLSQLGIGARTDEAPAPEATQQSPGLSAIHSISQELEVDPNSLQPGTPEYDAFLSRVRERLQGAQRDF